MSPGQGLYLHAVAIATPTMTNTRARLYQVGEAQRSRSLGFHHSEELLILGFDLSGNVSQGLWFGGCPVKRGLCSQRGKDDARPTGTLDIQVHRRGRYLCPPKHLRVLWQLTSCMVTYCPLDGCFAPVGNVRQVLEQIHGPSEPTGSEAERRQSPIHGHLPRSQSVTPSALLAESLYV